MSFPQPTNASANNQANTRFAMMRKKMKSKKKPAGKGAVPPMSMGQSVMQRGPGR